MNKYVKCFESFINEQHLIAPNGKSSNLTPQQFKLVNTQEFKKWFGDSKVVDENNVPLVVYHHSEKSFNEFIKNKGYNSSLLAGVEEVQRHGFFFSTDFNFSKRYGKYEYPVFLKIVKPFNFKEHYFYKNNYPYYSELFDEFIEFAEENNIDLEYDYLTKSLKIPPDYNWKFLDDEIGEIFISFLIRKGYDGIFFTEFNKEENDEYSIEYQSIAVFNSNQIKLANGDNIKFTDSNDIRF